LHFDFVALWKLLTAVTTAETCAGIWAIVDALGELTADFTVVDSVLIELLSALVSFGKSLLAALIAV
jgi:hypothetical protein